MRMTWFYTAWVVFITTTAMMHWQCYGYVYDTDDGTRITSSSPYSI